MKNRINEPKIWLAIVLLALPTLTSTTNLKQNKSEDDKIDFNTSNNSRDVHLPTDINNFLTYVYNKQTKNESYLNTADDSQTNKENESKLKSPCMTISDGNNDKNAYGNTDAANITNVYNNECDKDTFKDAAFESTEINNTSKISNNKDLFNDAVQHVAFENTENFNTPEITKNEALFRPVPDQNIKNISNESRHFKEKSAVVDNLGSFSNAVINDTIYYNDKVNENTKTFKINKNADNKTSRFKVQAREVINAIDFGFKALKELVKVKEPQLYKLGIFLDKDHPAARVANFGAPIGQKAILMSRVGYATLEASKKIAESYPQTVGRQSAGIPSELQSRIDLDVCPLRRRPRCPPASRRFRTSDGTCNNLEHPWRGSAMLPMQRFLPPVYQDGIQSIRLSVFDEPLPSARQISTVIHRDRNQEIQSVTLMFMQWGQFIDHDITSTVKARGFNGSIPRCCDGDGSNMLPSDLLHPSCLPIKVSRTDPFLSHFGIGCMEFIRSAPSTRIDCELGWREQINQATPYIDASTIYGSDVDTSDSIRTFRNGQIVYGRDHSQGPLNPPDPPDGELCTAGALSDECLRPGDARLTENPGLVAMHTVFVRYHNKVAFVLSKINPHWSDERVFQETKRIVYSVVQHITYREYLPVVLGPEVMDLFELRVLKKGYYDKYDKRVTPGIANSFSTAAFRFGHSMVQNSFIRTDSHHIPLENNVSLHEEFSNFENIWSFGSVDRTLLGLFNQPSQRRDEFIAEELTNHLFQFSGATPFGMDLAAINIQRGRDHGIPPYTFWRKPCGLSPITGWRDLEKVMSINSVIRLKSLYLHVDDIDLFTGGLAEKPLRAGVVGPTFACIIAQQFSNLRRGDRFWYENEGFESSFSPAQLQQIRRVSLAQIICQTTDEIETIQPYVFLSADNLRNIRVFCDSPEIRNFDLGAWTEKSFEFNSISENLDPFEEERSQRDIDLTRGRRKTNSYNHKNMTKSTKPTIRIQASLIKYQRLQQLLQIRQKTLKYLPNLIKHRRTTRSTKKKTKTITNTDKPKHSTIKPQTKTNSTTKKADKNRPTATKPVHVTSKTVPVEAKVLSFNVPKKTTTSRPAKQKPQYYQIQDQNHNDLTYLVGIVPTTQATPLQVNINIHVSQQSTPTSNTVSPIKKKKRPQVSTTPHSLTNYYVTSNPISTRSHTPSNSYGESGVGIITRSPPRSTKRPTTAVSYPTFMYSPVYERPNIFEPTTKKPTYFFDNFEFVTTKAKRPNTNAYNSPTDAFNRPLSIKPSTGYYAGNYDDINNLYGNAPLGVFTRPINSKPSTTYHISDYYNNNDAYETIFDKQPIYISTSDYNQVYSSSRPAVFESKPFSTSNNRVSTDSSSYNTDKYSSKRPFGSSFFDNDNERNVVVITNNQRRPQTTAYNRDENYSSDEILNEFFNGQNDNYYSTDRKSNDPTNDNLESTIASNINDKLDFKSRVVYKKADKGDVDKDEFVEISSVKKQEYFENIGDDVLKGNDGELKISLQRKQKRSVKKIKVVEVDVMPSESRNQWIYFDVTEEPTTDMDVPELPVNMPCSDEVPKPITAFLPSRAEDSD